MIAEKKDLVMLVDDEEHIVNSLKIYLEMEGFSVITANRGKKALEILETQIPSILLLDVMMPEMDGFEVLQEIRKNESLKNLPIVMLTAKSQDEDILRGFKEEVASYMTKPFNLDELVSTIRMILKKQN